MVDERVARERNAALGPPVTLDAFLRIPLTLVVESAPDGDRWVRRARFVQLPESEAVGEDMEAVVAEAERRRVVAVVRRLARRTGWVPSGEPLSHGWSEQRLRAAGLGDLVEHLDTDVEQLPRGLAEFGGANGGDLAGRRQAV